LSDINHGLRVQTKQVGKRFKEKGKKTKDKRIKIKADKAQGKEHRA
jgi:hypothetical protein